MTITRRAACRGLALTMVLGVAACGGGPKQTPIDVKLNADLGINPNSSGEASPVVVRVYELKSLKAFKNADYFDFVDDDTKTLGADLISSREFEVQPGKSQDYDSKISGEAAYIGVVAGFRAIQSSQWRDSIELRKGKKNKLVISLTSLSVSIDKRRRSFFGT